MNIITFITLWLLNSSIYNQQFQNIDGVSQPMSQFQNKKILLVNIATGSSRVSQLAALQQLQQQYADSLVVIGFPSGSFGHESRTNAEIKQFCQSNYGVSFMLAQKNPIAGPEIQSIYNWLTNLNENGRLGETVKGDFQKFLINQSGELIGVFAPSVDPMSEELRNALDN